MENSSSLSALSLVSPIGKTRVIRGDVWLLGDHRVMCGDCRSGDLQVLLDGCTPDLLLSDPPYGIGWDTDYTRFSGMVDQPLENMGIAVTHSMGALIGDDVPFDPTPFLGYRDVILWGANHYKHLLPERGSWLVWDKRYRSGAKSFLTDAELAWCSRGNAVYIKSITSQGCVWPDGKRLHPTQKPVGLFEWCIDRFKSKPPRTVLDPYAGVGACLLACERLGRKCYCMEISPYYCGIMIDRWQKQTGSAAVLL